MTKEALTTDSPEAFPDYFAHVHGITEQLREEMGKHLNLDEYDPGNPAETVDAVELELLAAASGRRIDEHELTSQVHTLMNVFVENLAEGYAAVHRVNHALMVLMSLPEDHAQRAWVEQRVGHQLQSLSREIGGIESPETYASTLAAFVAVHGILQNEGATNDAHDAIEYLQHRNQKHSTE